jgi:RNA polymerase sigma-70 factor (ECF subfamily)
MITSVEVRQGDVGGGIKIATGKWSDHLHYALSCGDLQTQRLYPRQSHDIRFSPSWVMPADFSVVQINSSAITSLLGVIAVGRLPFERTYSGMDESKSDQNPEFVLLLNAAHRPLLAYLVSLLGNRHDAEDVLQRASLTMWQRFSMFEPGTNFTAWACTVAFYEAKNFQRVSNRSRLHFREELLQTLADERVADLDNLDGRLDALDHCIAKLDELPRQLVQAAYFGDGSIAELANRLRRAPQTLYNKLNLIRRTLAECVALRLAERGDL